MRVYIFKGSGRCSIIHFSPLTFLMFYLLLLLCWFEAFHGFLFYYCFFFAPHQIMENMRDRENQKDSYLFFYFILFICGIFLYILHAYYFYYSHHLLLLFGKDQLKGLPLC